MTEDAGQRESAIYARNISFLGDIEPGFTSRQVPEKILRFVEEHPQEATSYQGYPSLVPEWQVEDLLEVSQTHRKFIREIMEGGFDLMLCTGSTSSLTGDVFLATAYLERKKGGGLTVKRYPSAVDWPSVYYFQKEDTGPNALVYKVLGESTTRLALQNAENASRLVGIKEEISARFPALNKEEGFEERALVVNHCREILGVLGRGDISSWNFSQRYEALLLLRSLKQEELDLLLFGLPEEQIGRIKGYIHYLKEEVDTVEKVASYYQGELDELVGELHQIHEKAQKGEYKSHKYSGNVVVPSDKEEKYEVEEGEPRVALMKALYPEAVVSLFLDYQKRVPKKIAFYDTVIDTGLKLRGYTGFFEALGLDGKVEFYIVFAKPSFKTPPYPPFPIHIGSRRYFETESLKDIQFMGKGWDRAVKYTKVNVPADERPEVLSQLKQYQAVRMRAILDQLSLNDLVGPLKARFRRVCQLGHNTEAVVAEMMRGLDSLSSSVLTRTYHDFIPQTYSRFEGLFLVSDSSKELFRNTRRFLEILQEKIVPGQESVLVVNDETTYVAVRALLRTGKFPWAKGLKVRFVGFFDEPTGKDFKGPQSLFLLGYSYPRKEYVEKFNKGTGLEVYALCDDRKPYSSEQREKDFAEAQKSSQFETSYYNKDVPANLVELRELVQNDQALLEKTANLALIKKEEELAKLATLLKMFVPEAEWGDFNLEVFLSNIKTDFYKQWKDTSFRERVVGTPQFKKFQDIMDLVAEKSSQSINEALALFKWQPDFKEDIEAIRAGSFSEWQRRLELVRLTFPQVEEMTEILGTSVFANKIYVHELERITTSLQKYEEQLGWIIQSNFRDKFYPDTQVVSTKPQRYKPYISTWFDPRSAEKVADAVKFAREMEGIRYLSEVAAFTEEV